MSTLYIVATPIGNLEDITLRALRILKEVNFIICEDTRVTSKLLARYEIQKPLISYFQHSRLSRMEEIIARLGRGESAALVTDAGTPGISDPGGKLVNLITHQLNNCTVVAIPGPSALTTALSISGLPADSFLFVGFPPHKRGRQKFWRQVVENEATVVFYESPHRILKSLEQLREVLCTPSPQPSPPQGGEGVVGESTLPVGEGQGEGRQIVVARELTKMFENVYRGTIAEVIEKVQNDPVKGEYVVAIGRKK